MLSMDSDERSPYYVPSPNRKRDADFKIRFWMRTRITNVGMAPVLEPPDWIDA